MIKAILILSLLSSPLFAQDLQGLVNDASAAAGNFLAQVGGVDQTEDTVALTLNEYEWVLTSNEGELELSVFDLPTNANNLGAALAGLLASVGSAAQDNADQVGDALTNTEDAGVVIQDNGAASDVASAYGEQLQDNADSLSASLQDSYNQAAAALSTNANGALDQANQQINNAAQNQDLSTENLGNVIASVVGNNANLNNLPGNLVSVSGNTNAPLENLAAPLAGAASNLASGVDANQAVAAYNNAAGSAADTVSSLPSGVADAVNNAASSAANSASSGLGNLGADANNVANQALNAAAASNVNLPNVGTL